MTDRQIIRNVRASFMMEGLCPSKKEEKIGLGIYVEKLMWKMLSLSSAKNTCVLII